MPAKSLPRLLALAMILMMILSVPAMAQPCALCSAETHNDAYICAGCMLDLLAEKDMTGGMEITGAVAASDGSVTLSWKDEANNGPYNVYYELLDGAPVAFGWTAARNVSGHAVSLNHLVPGVSYVFTVENGVGNRVQTIYYAPAVETGNDIGAKIRIHTRIHNGERLLEYPFSASEIMLDNGKAHGFYLKMAYSTLRRVRSYAFTVTVEAPGGFADVVLSGNLVLGRGKSEVPAWGFVELDEYFSYLERYYGGVPAGEYLVTMNFNGIPAFTVPFTVQE